MACDEIAEVIRECSDELTTIPGVVGLAQGLRQEQPYIQVFVIAQTPELRCTLPRFFEGYPVRIQETGPIKIVPKKLQGRNFNLLVPLSEKNLDST